MKPVVIPKQFKSGPWHDGTLYDIRTFIDGQDTYPNDFTCYVEVRTRATGEILRCKGRGKYIGNFSPIWIRFGKRSLQLTEILRLTEPV